MISALVSGLLELLRTFSAAVPTTAAEVLKQVGRTRTDTKVGSVTSDLR